jgi:UDP-glucose 4-epimerase
VKVVISGITGALARMVTDKLLARKHTVYGIDRRPWPDAPKGVEMVKADIRKRPAEDVFRTKKPDALIHMATVTHFSTRFEERYRINLGGTRAMFDHCHQYGVKQAVFVGRHTVYGAAPDAPLYRTEAEPPLAAATFPELADLVAADLFAQSAIWRWPDLSTAVLRLVYTLGPSRRGTLSNFLGTKRTPSVMGFDPLYHFMHEDDAAESIVLAVEKGLNGVFNVAGPAPVPWSLLCREATGRRPVPVPEWLLPHVLGRFGFPKLPVGAINHIKHPVVIDASAFVEATGFEHQFDEVQTMDSARIL